MSSESNTTKYLVSCPPQPQYIHQAGLRTYGRIPASIVELFSPKLTNHRCGGSVGLAGNHIDCRRTNFPIILT